MNYKGGLNFEPCELCNNKEWIVYKDKNHICSDCYNYIYTHPINKLTGDH